MTADADLSDAIAHEDHPYQNHIGWRIGAWREGYCEIHLDVDDRHINRNGFCHGGVVMTLLDSTMGYAACFCPVPGHFRRLVTVTQSTCFTGSAHRGLIRAIGRLRGGGRRIVACQGEVLDHDGKLVAIGEATYRYMRGSESLEGVPRHQEEAGEG